MVVSRKTHSSSKGISNCSRKKAGGMIRTEIGPEIEATEEVTERSGAKETRDLPHGTSSAGTEDLEVGLGADPETLTVHRIKDLSKRGTSKSSRVGRPTKLTKTEHKNHTLKTTLAEAIVKGHLGINRKIEWRIVWGLRALIDNLCLPLTERGMIEN
tara:strand:+ start:1273 stop:1743 length:471 start_codon:yes stop_codon:yes gene_type:complete